MDHGSSIVQWAARSACIRPGGKHLTYKHKHINILWFEVRGMRSRDFDSLFDNKLKSNPPANYLLVHLGLNDLGKNDLLCRLELIHTIKCSSLRCKVLVPGMTMILSDILLRLYWHNTKSASKIDATHKARGESGHKAPLHRSRCFVTTKHVFMVWAIWHSYGTCSKE